MPESDPPATEPDAVFSMDPQATLWTLARQLVEGQRTLAGFREQARAAEAAPESPARQSVLAEYAKLRTSWFTEAFPSLVASIALAIEVYDTNGPGMTTISDPVEAAAYNNKYFVWTKQLSVDD